MSPVVSNLRPQVSNLDIDNGLDDLSSKLFQRIAQKGQGSYASKHEVFGILAEEFKEVLDELQDNSPKGYDNFGKELLDTAVAAIYGYICIKYGYITVPVVSNDVTAQGELWPEGFPEEVR